MKHGQELKDMTETSNNFEELFIDEKFVIKTAIKQMDKALRKILFVTDKEKRLLGTVTGGDIRRWILANGDLEQHVDKIFNKNPISVKSSASPKKIKTTMLTNRIEYLPVLDDGQRIVDVIYWGDLFGKDMRESAAQPLEVDVPVVIMAGGKGDRMDPFTKILPKPLIPIGDKPILELIIQEFRKHGMREFILVLNYKAEMIESYFNNIEKDYTIKYIRESESMGTAGGLKLLNDIVGQTFIVSNCDVIVKANLNEVVNFHREKEADLTIISSIQHHKIPYGVIQFRNGGEVVDMIEKPEYTFTVNTGLYIVSKEILKFIPKDTAVGMDALIADLLRNKKKVLTYPVNESEYMDVGQWEEYKKSIAKLQIGL